MATLRIRNWAHFQQYKDRCPPWIKLHRELLQSEDWIMWDDASRVLAVACMLLASRTEDGTIPCNPGYLTRAGYLNQPADLRPLVACGFLLFDGDNASELYTTLASCTTETETETEKETEEEARPKRPRTPQKFIKPTLEEVQNYCKERRNGVDAEAWVAFYESNGWRVGSNPMKSWKGAVVTWEKRNKAKAAPKKLDPGSAEYWQNLPKGDGQ